MSVQPTVATGERLPGTPGAHPVAVVVARAGEPQTGADEAVAEADGLVVVVGERAAVAAQALTAARQAWVLETGPGLRPGALAAQLASSLLECPLVILPGSPDGRHLAPRLAAALGRPLLAWASGVQWVPDAAVAAVADVTPGRVLAVLGRLEGRLELPVEVAGPAVATLPPGGRSVPATQGAVVVALDTPEEPAEGAPAAGPDVQVLEVLDPQPETMDLAEARLVVAGGAGLVPAGAAATAGKATFDLLARVAAALGASVGATRVVTDAGWLGYERQIGTTGVAVAPELYIALGISGATQHTGGIGSPRHCASINTDSSCPMTAMADLGVVTDAPALLVELAHRLGVAVPEGVPLG